MNDTGRWIRNGEKWHVVQKQDGSVECNSENGSFTAAYAETWETWKRCHGWERATTSGHLTPTR